MVKQKHLELQLRACEEMMMFIYDMNTGNVMVMLCFFFSLNLEKKNIDPHFFSECKQENMSLQKNNFKVPLSLLA